MQDALRRLLVLALVLGLSAAAFYLVRSRTGGYGLIDVLAGRQRPGGDGSAVGFTPAVRPAVRPSDVELLARFNRELATLVGAVRPSVVSVQALPKEQAGAGAGDPTFGFRQGRADPVARESASVGSGVIVSKEGHIVTNYHVVENHDRILIQTSDGKVYHGKFINASAGNDLAVLQIVHDGTRDFPALAFGNSDEVRAGEMVFAFGNPFGFGESVTQGIINALPRPISDSGFEMFQTDTVISPGYSGGPLVSLRGEIIGINVARYVYTQSPDEWQGLGFAIPSNDVRRVFETMMRTGRDLVGYLGVELAYEPARSNAAGENGIALAVEITAVTPESPADKAGFRPGDQLLSFGGVPIESQAMLIRRIQSAPIGEPVKVKVDRDGNIIELAPEIGDYSEFFASQAQPGELTDVEKVLAEQTGLGLTHLNAFQRRRAGLQDSAPGILVKDIRRDGNANRPLEVRDALREGDIIVQVDKEMIFSPQQFYSALKRMEPGHGFHIWVVRDGRAWRVPVIVPDQESQETDTPSPQP